MAVLVAADEHGQSAQPVPGGDDAVLRHDHDGSGALDHLLGIKDPVQDGVLLVDQRRRQLRGIDLAGAHRHKLVAVFRKMLLHQLLVVVDDPHGGDGIQSQMGPDQKGLGVCIADAADPHGAMEFRNIALELGSERCALDAVDLPLEAVLLIIDDHAASPCAQVGMVIHPEEHIQNHVFPGDRAEKSAHVFPFLSKIVG